MNNKKKEYPDGLKECKACKQSILLEKFSFTKAGRPVQPCKPCRAEKMRKKRSDNPEWRKMWDKKSRERYHKLQAENGISLEGEKFCNDCKEYLPKSEFNMARGTSSGQSSYCKICAGVRSSKYRKSPYSITREDYNKFLTYQNEVCGICFQQELIKRKLSTDHNYITGEVRGLLCSRCNRFIGAMKDNIEWLDNATNWVKNNGVRDFIYNKGEI